MHIKGKQRATIDLVHFLKLFIKFMLYFLIAIAVLIAAYYLGLAVFTKASNDRNWAPDQTILPSANFTGDTVTISNIRNFTYASTTKYTQQYYNKTFDLSKIKNVYYIVEPFSGLKGSAHTFLSFEFEGDEFVSISIEIRKEVGEKFSPLKGMLNQYEIMYVVADERDVVKLRSNYRKDQVYVYPIEASPEKIRSLFVHMLERANSLKENPEFYHTLTNNCTSNIADHVNTISPKRVAWNFSYILPGYSDKYIYDKGLIRTDLSFEEARKKYHINDRATKHADDPNFSVLIRN